MVGAEVEVSGDDVAQTLETTEAESMLRRYPAPTPAECAERHSMPTTMRAICKPASAAQRPAAPHPPPLASYEICPRIATSIGASRRSPPIASPEKAVPVASLGVAVIVAFSRTPGLTRSNR